MKFSGHSALSFIERTGNKLPNPSLLFIYLCLFILALSAVLAALDVQVTHPINHSIVHAQNLLSQQGLHRILKESVTNFTSFAPVGTVLVAVLGIGVAEHSGLLRVLFSYILSMTPRYFLSAIVVLMGIMSSLAADTGYVVLIPLAAILFKNAGLNPIAGIAAAFAGVSGGFSANLLISPLDSILAGISTEAAQLVDANYEVHAAGNYYFMLASTFFIAFAGAWVTEKITLKRYQGEFITKSQLPPISSQEKKGLKGVAIFTALFITLICVGLIPDSGILRDPQTHSILRSPFISGIVVIVSLYCGLAGLIFGKLSGTFKQADESISAMESTMTTMASYLVLMFFAAQFVNYFAWSQAGSIIAISGAKALSNMQLNSAILLVVFVFTAAFINLFIGSASAKWALLAPIFVPMFLLLGIAPEATQIAYRIGDSSTNIITPLMPYFGVVVAYVQKYDKEAGIGTISSMMIPYSITFLIGWSLLLFIWMLVGLPLGFG